MMRLAMGMGYGHDVGFAALQVVYFYFNTNNHHKK
jgi:hypothetical protein